MAVPNPPSLLQATVVDAGQVDLTWQDNSSDEVRFIIERDPWGSFDFQQEWGEIAVEPPNTESFTDDRTAAETTYQYRIRAYNDDGVSLPSNVAQVTTPAAPPLLVGPPPVPTPEVRIPLERPPIEFLSANAFGVEEGIL